ncbi:MAG: hypothetical protein BGP04_17465 [Rhizobiales bacterium 62-17]|nr:hypothetical protein [Hyphomicrobiales bacterium]OJY03513.1 MAG: hypothetical protein BGP04_17465 [Rhizobiales bacterium 62-17]
MLPFIPVYALYFTNELGFELKNEIIIDASNDVEASEKAEAILALNARTAAVLCADQRIIRQFTVQPEPRSDRSVRRHARELAVGIRDQ